MLDFSMEIKICTLQEYLYETDMTEEQVWEEQGVVAQHYVYAVGEGSDYCTRIFVPVVYGNYTGAIREATEGLLEDYAEYLREE